MKKLTLRELQMSELAILSAFHEFCKKNNLNYSLAGGTLLGAIRHKGFIPWDDDIDVCMPRPDYEKFYNSFHDQKSDFILSIDRGKNAQYPFLKLMDPRISVKEDNIAEVENCWIDIFPIDGFPAKQQKVIVLQKKANFYRDIIRYSKLEGIKGYKGKRSKISFYIRKLYSTLYGYKRAHNNLIKLAKDNKYTESKYVGCVVWGFYGIGERMLKSEYEKFVDVEFEGHTFKAMSCWDSYLTGIYGDYMQLPPEEKRVYHGIKAYRVEEENE